MIKLSKNTSRLLKLFYSHPEESYYIQQIGRILKKKPGVFQRALYGMEKQGILLSEFKANARFFRANKNYPIYKELRVIVFKTQGLALFMVFAFIFLLSGVAFCQEKGVNSAVLNSLNDAIAISYKNNIDVRIQEEELKVSRADILGARSAFLPDVNLDASYTRRGAVLQSGSAGKKDYGVFSGYKNDNRLGVSINETIYSGGANTANLKTAELGLLEQDQTLRATKLNVELEVRRLYYGLLLAYETKRIAKDLVDQANAHYLDTKKRFEQGTVSKFDVLQSKVQVSLLIPELIKAENSIDIIKADLNKQLGLKIQNEIVVQDKLDFTEIEVKENELLKEAYLNKPEMILKSLGIDIAKWQIKYARSGWLPQVEASAEYEYRSNNTANMFNSRHNNWNIGVALTLPLFDGFSTKSKVDAAKAKYLESILSKENVSDQIAVDIRQACLDLKQALAVISSQRDNLEDAREALRISEIRFDNGIGVNLDVLDAQVSLAKVEENLAQAVYDYLMAQARLDRSTGRQIFKEAKDEKKG